MGKLWTFSQIGLTPPPLSDISDLFEFQTYLENADFPPPLSDTFEFENILMAEDPRINILKGLLRHIYIEKGQIKCFNV